jgi:hypothetical protein
MADRGINGLPESPCERYASVLEEAGFQVQHLAARNNFMSDFNAFLDEGMPEWWKAEQFMHKRMFKELVASLHKRKITGCAT